MELRPEPDGSLTLKRDGHDDAPNVRLRRAFPWSKAGAYVSVRDDKGKELVMIDRLSDLAPQERQLVEAWLADNSFIPTIRRVRRVNTDFGQQEWEVDTDRGLVTFRVQEREDVRFLDDGRFSIKDMDGNIYALPRLDQLDRESVRAVEGVL